MTLKNLKDLEAAMQLCVKHGIRTLKVGNVELNVELPQPVEVSIPNTQPHIPQTTYTDADYLLWSAGPQQSES